MSPGRSYARATIDNMRPEPARATVVGLKNGGCGLMEPKARPVPGPGGRRVNPSGPLPSSPLCILQHLSRYHHNLSPRLPYTNHAPVQCCSPFTPLRTSGVSSGSARDEKTQGQPRRFSRARGLRRAWSTGHTAPHGSISDGSPHDDSFSCFFCIISVTGMVFTIQRLGLETLLGKTHWTLEPLCTGHGCFTMNPPVWGNRVRIV